MSDASDAAAELALLTGALDAAAARLPAPPQRYRIAGEVVAVHAGASAAPMLEAFSALRSSADPGRPALDIFVLDGAADGLALPDTAIARRDVATPGGLGAFAGSGVRAFSQPDAGVLSVLDEPRRRAYCWLRDVAALPYYEFAAPLRHILQWWMLGRGGALLHSAAIGTGEGGVLIVGPSGSGKSTTALACQEAGLGFTSDDYVLVAAGDPPTAHMAYSTAKIVRANLGAHRNYEHHFRNLSRTDEKPMMFMHEVAPERVLKAFPVRAIVLPVVAGSSSTRIVRAGAAELLRALAPSSILLFPLAGATAFRRIADLCRSLPCLRAELAADPRDVAAAFARLIGNGGRIDLAAAA